MKKTDTHSVTVRLPVDVHQKLKKIADDMHRSMSKQVIVFLADAVARNPTKATR